MLRRCRSLALVPFAVFAGCSLPEQRPDYDSLDPAERTLATVETNEDRDRRDIPELIEQLDSSDAAVRMLAAGTLLNLTGETHGYHFADSESERRQAVDRWEAWWKQQDKRVLSGEPTSLKE